MFCISGAVSGAVQARLKGEAIVGLAVKQQQKEETTAMRAVTRQASGVMSAKKTAMLGMWTVDRPVCASVTLELWEHGSVATETGF
jgi:hypothetical protein